MQFYKNYVSYGLKNCKLLFLLLVDVDVFL